MDRARDELVRVALPGAVDHEEAGDDDGKPELRVKEAGVRRSGGLAQGVRGGHDGGGPGLGRLFQGAREHDAPPAEADAARQDIDGRRQVVAERGDHVGEVAGREGVAGEMENDLGGAPRHELLALLGDGEVARGDGEGRRTAGGGGAVNDRPQLEQPRSDRAPDEPGSARDEHAPAVPRTVRIRETCPGLGPGAHRAPPRGGCWGSGGASPTPEYRGQEDASSMRRASKTSASGRAVPSSSGRLLNSSQRVTITTASTPRTASRSVSQTVTSRLKPRRAEAFATGSWARTVAP